jgi:hypothetical protein
VAKLRSGWSEIKRYDSTGDTEHEQAKEIVK